MGIKSVVFLLLAMVCIASAFVCPRDYCSRVDCANVDRSECELNNNGIYREKGTVCGCCPACLIKLNEGESCFGMMLRGMPPKVACAQGLICDPRTVKCTRIEN